MKAIRIVARVALCRVRRHHPAEHAGPTRILHGNLAQTEPVFGRLRGLRQMGPSGCPVRAAWNRCAWQGSFQGSNSMLTSIDETSLRLSANRDG